MACWHFATIFLLGYRSSLEWQPAPHSDPSKGAYVLAHRRTLEHHYRYVTTMVYDAPRAALVIGGYGVRVGMGTWPCGVPVGHGHGRGLRDTRFAWLGAGGEVSAGITHWRLVAGDPYYERIESMHGELGLLGRRDDAVVQALGAMPWAEPTLPVHLALDPNAARLAVVDIHGGVQTCSLPSLAPGVRWPPDALQRMLGNARVPGGHGAGHQQLAVVLAAPIVVWVVAALLQATPLQTAAIVLVVIVGYALRAARLLTAGKAERVVQAQWWDDDSLLLVTSRGRVAVCPLAEAPHNRLGKSPGTLGGAAWAGGALEGRACLLACTVDRVPLRAAVHAHMVAAEAEAEAEGGPRGRSSGSPTTRMWGGRSASSQAHIGWSLSAA
jgi:hypothetical protein